MKKKHYLILFVVALLIALVSVFLKKPGNYKLTPKTEAKQEPAAELNYLPSATHGKIVAHQYYTLSYVEKHEQAEWVAYELTKAEALGTITRKDAFREDPSIQTGSATLDDYKKSGYDRGHLAPAADMKFSKEAMSESFFMSNMAPQKPSFNRGIWKELEEKVREWAVQNDRIYVVTGGVLTDGLSTIGADKVSVPKYFYKVVLDYTEPETKAIAFVLPNQNSKKPLSSFAVSIDSVEKLTGIDFFPALPDDAENALERMVTYSLWDRRN
ncbi:DNA/RNA non-specific endonuclease [Chloroherpeton thalassium ATCC 35110]|uniref:Endonuclease n=2 Tax=Chloroherpeton thalassium TaxID=100716 RepID=B3QTR6_CHLT3|nr:DNA/RNA non-specific endonuclease [Chloroherpeton thalassium ATCC 35110]